MKLGLKLSVLAFIAVGVAIAERGLDAVEPELAQEAALEQFDDSAAPARTMRVHRQARHDVADLLWLAVPIAAIALFSGDLARFLAAREPFRRV